jgi:hypothetical protein
MFIRHIPVSNARGAAFAVQIGFPDDQLMLAITLTALPHCYRFLFIPQNLFKYLRPGH